MRLPIPTRLLLLLAAATLATFLTAPAWADSTVDFQRNQSFQKRYWENQLNEMPVLDPSHPSRATADLFSLAVMDGQLVLRTTVPSTTPGLLRKVKLDDSPDWSLLTILDGAAGNDPVIPTSFSLQCNHFDATHSNSISIQQRKGTFFIITLQQWSPAGRHFLNLQVQNLNPRFSVVGGCRLTIVDQKLIPGEHVTPLNFSSGNFSAFLREHPLEADQYLRPLFHQLGQDEALAPDPMLAFEVFSDQWVPNAAMTAKVNALVANLGGGDFHSRTRAQNDLAALGKDAAIILIRLDRTKLSPEQNARLDKVLSPYQPEPTDKAAKLRNDPSFLLNCLYSDDAIIRKAAFAQLQSVTKLKLIFDPAAARPTRNAAIPPILKQLLDAKVIVPKS